MATTRIKDISSTVTSLASDDYIAVDGATNGTRKMVRSSIYTDVAAAFTGAPTTYDICPLNSGTNKIDATYLPTSGDTPKGEWNASTNSPSLADGSGTAGDYYDVTTAGTQDLGSGSIAYTVGDVVKYNGSTWYKIDSVANILDGSATAADGRSALSVNSIDEDAQANGTKVTAPALYFNGSSSVVTVADDDKLTFSSSAEFGTNSSGTWSPDDNTPALTDGTGTLNQHYRVDAGAGTVTQGASTLSIINGTATTAGQAVYYDGSVWRLKDVDDLPFSISAWVKILDADGCRIVGKYAASNTHREYNFGTAPTTGKLRLQLRDITAYSPTLNSTDSMSGYVGQWVHVACSYAGSGPNSTNAFSVALGSGGKLYINGVLDPTAVASDFASYGGMSNTAQALTIGLSDNEYGNAEIRDVKIFNRELTATEVSKLAKGNDLGFADEWGGALGGVYTSDFSAGVDGWFGTRATLAGNIDAIGGQDDTLRLTVSADNNNHSAGKLNLLTTGKRYRVSLSFYIPSANSHVDGFKVSTYSGAAADVIINESSPTLDQWNAVSGDFLVTNDDVFLIPSDGGSVTINDAGADDVIYFKNIKITALGNLADFRSERFDSSTGKWYDLSDNAYVGTSANLPTLTGRAYPVYETGTWTPTVTFGGGSTGITYTTQEGLYTRVGNTVWVSAYVLLSAKGSDTGTALINGLPFTASNTAASSQSFVVGNAANAANLTSAITAYATDNGTTINLVDWGATGSAVLDDTNFAATTALSITGTYQIQ